MRCTAASRKWQISFSCSLSFSWFAYSLVLASPRRWQRGTGSACRFISSGPTLSARLVFGPGKHFRSFPLVLCRQLRRTELIVQLVDGACECEWNLIVEVHRRAGIEPDVKRLVDRHQ